MQLQGRVGGKQDKGFGYVDTVQSSAGGVAAQLRGRSLCCPPHLLSKLLEARPYPPLVKCLLPHTRNDTLRSKEAMAGRDWGCGAK